jgi:DNA-binding MarR family transcriptional regulator
MLGREPTAMTQGMMSYHLRRLRLHGLIERIPHTHRYSVTDFGLAAAVFLTRAHARFTGAGLAHLVGADPPSSLRHAMNRLDTELDHLAQRSGLAA